MAPFLQQVDIGGEKFDLGSDMHWRVGPDSPAEVGRRFADAVIEEKSSSTLLLPGDLFDVECPGNSGELINVSDCINVALHHLGNAYRWVMYVPGNHCLRRNHATSDPWNDIDPPKNVLMPRGANPVGFTFGKTRGVLANVFYDGKFLPSHPISDESALRDLYASTADGRWLLRGNDAITAFRRMTQEAAAAIEPDVNLLLTHAPSEPSSAVWFVENEDVDDASADFPGSVIYHPGFVHRKASRMKMSENVARQRMNNRTALLGSNVFHPRYGARPKDGLVTAFGHHHRNEDRLYPLPGGSLAIRIISKQFAEWGV